MAACAIDDFTEVRAYLEAHGVACQHGLSREELAAAEERVGARFPADLAEMLRTFVPCGPRFPEWRDLKSRSLAERILWPGEIGSAPADAARLIPIFAQRYLPAFPRDVGNPVFSVQREGVVLYANDLRCYLAAEFGVDILHDPDSEPRHVPFWSEFTGVV